VSSDEAFSEKLLDLLILCYTIDIYDFFSPRYILNYFI